MVSENKISAGQAASLLAALGQSRKTGGRTTQSQGDSPRWFRVRVTDTFSGRPKASVSIPIGLMNWGLKIGAHFAPEVSNLDMNELAAALREGAEGKIVDVIDEEDGEHVEIYIE
jgi:hypothetical protein